MKYRYVLWLTGMDEDPTDPLPRQITLTHGWKLVSSSSIKAGEEIEQITRMLPTMQSRSFISETKFALIKDFDGSGVPWPSSNTDSNRIAGEGKWVTLALRAIKHSDFTVTSQIFEKVGKTYKARFAQVNYDTLSSPHAIPRKDRLFSSGDQYKIRKFSRTLIDEFLNNKGEDNNILSSLEIYEDALKQDQYITRIVLIVIALEVIYCYDKDNIAEQLAFGSSYLLENTPKSRKKLYWDIKELYSVRSNIAHTGQPHSDRKMTQEKQSELIGEAFRIFRRTIDQILNKDLLLLFKADKKRTLREQSLLIKLGNINRFHS